MKRLGEFGEVASQGPEGGSQGHAASFLLGGTWPPNGSGTCSIVAGGAGMATGGGEFGGSAESSELDSSSESRGLVERSLCSRRRYSSSSSSDGIEDVRALA